MHVAFYNENLSRIEMHLKARKNLEITSPFSPKIIHIEKEETIHTENSYKFTIENIRNLAKRANLQIQKQYMVNNNWFSLVLLIKLSD